MKVHRGRYNGPDGSREEIGSRHRARGEGERFADHWVSFDLVAPGTWQKAFGLARKKGEAHGKWKARLRQKAQQLFPQLGRRVTLKTCDALLIAEYGRRRG
jgi:hypothetical protein